MDSAIIIVGIVVVCFLLALMPVLFPLAGAIKDFVVKTLRKEMAKEKRNDSGIDPNLPQG